MTKITCTGQYEIGYTPDIVLRQMSGPKLGVKRQALFLQHSKKLPKHQSYFFDGETVSLLKLRKIEKRFNRTVCWILSG